MRHRRHGLALAALLGMVAIAFFFGLGQLSLLGPDEPRFAEVAREMFTTGDYITPRVAGAPAFDKPALLYWAIAGAFRLFGVNEFAARLPSALAALACVAFLYHAVARSLSVRLAWIIAATLATNVFFIGFSRAVIMDMTFTATVAMALLSIYLCAMSAGRERLFYWLIAAAAAELRPGEKMTFYQNKNYAPVFYGAGRAVTSPKRGEGLNSFELREIVAALASEASLIVITTAGNQSVFTNNPRFDAEVIGQQGNHRALRVRLAQSDNASE